MAKAAPRRWQDADAVDIAGIRVTHPDRVLYDAQGITKRTLAAYYLEVAKWMLPHATGRPLSLVRCPRGSGGDCFFQKHANPGWPAGFKSVRIREKSGAGDYLYIEDERGLVAAVQMGVLELHVWGCGANAIERPDRLVFDLDPDEDLPFSAVRDAAYDMKKRLEAFDLKSFALVTGGKGVHVVVPLAPGHSWDAHRGFAEALSRQLAKQEPNRFVAVTSKAKRRGRIFVDFLRNQRGASAIAPYSTRAKPGAKIAMPLTWRALARLTEPAPASVRNAGRLLAAGDPWPDYFRLRQRLPRMPA